MKNLEKSIFCCTKSRFAQSRQNHVLRQLLVPFWKSFWSFWATFSHLFVIVAVMFCNMCLICLKLRRKYASKKQTKQEVPCDPLKDTCQHGLKSSKRWTGSSQTPSACMCAGTVADIHRYTIYIIFLHVCLGAHMYPSAACCYY